MTKKIRCLLLLCIIFSLQKSFAQTIEINGLVSAKSNLEGIHVINKTSQYYTTTDAKGVFLIKAKLNDTLAFSSVQYKLLTIKIVQETIEKKTLFVELNEHINELNEVLIGNTLTGNLLEDINNIEGEPEINFYDVGIPGYKGKPKTQNEQRLYEAGVFKPKMILGLLGGTVPLNPILNGISGRTKRLKMIVELESKDNYIRLLKDKYADIIFKDNAFEEHQIKDYFFFCSDDEKFIEVYNSNSTLVILEFLENKLKVYQKNLELKD